MYKFGESLCVSIITALSMFFFSLRGNLGAALIMLLVVILCFQCVCGNSIVVNRNSILLACYIILFAVIVHFFRTIEFRPYLIIGYLVAALYLVLVREIETYNVLWSFLKVIAILQAFAILFQCFVPELYYLGISLILPHDVVVSIQNRLLDGYYTGLTREVSYTMVFIVVGLGLFIYKKNKKSYDYMAIVLLFFALLISGKRATILFFAMAVFVVQFLKCSNKTKQFKYIFVGVLGLTLVAISYPIWSRIGALQRMVQLINFFKTGDLIGITNGRTKIYQTAIDLWENAKVFGIGWGNFKYLVPDDMWYAGFDVHNCYLQILCETGIIGFAIFILLMGMVIMGIIRVAALTKDKSYQYYSLACFCIFFQIFFLMYSLTEPILYEYPSYILFFICIGIMNSFLAKSERKSK